MPEVPIVDRLYQHAPQMALAAGVTHSTTQRETRCYGCTAPTISSSETSLHPKLPRDMMAPYRSFPAANRWYRCHCEVDVSNIQDVARRASVAPITVSRVVNGKGYVTQALRSRVEQAIAELGYVPNTVARSLRSRKTSHIALVIPDISNPFIAALARGTMDEAGDARYLVIFCNTDDDETKEAHSLRTLIEQRVDGVLLIPAGSGTDAIATVRASGTPLVALNGRDARPGVDVVRCDAEPGAHALGRLVASLGHQSFAILAGPKDDPSSSDCIAGFRRALGEAGVANRATVLRGPLTPAYGRELAAQAIAATPTPTAIFATSGTLAIGSLDHLRHTGVHVPDDVVLAVYDDLTAPIDPYLPLAVAAAPAYEMGRRAVRTMLDRIEGKAPEAGQEIVLDAELVIRGSSRGVTSQLV